MEVSIKNSKNTLEKAIKKDEWPLCVSLFAIKHRGNPWKDRSCFHFKVGAVVS